MRKAVHLRKESHKDLHCPLLLSTVKGVLSYFEKGAAAPRIPVNSDFTHELEHIEEQLKVQGVIYRNTDNISGHAGKETAEPIFNSTFTCCHKVWVVQ